MVCDESKGWLTNGLRTQVRVADRRRRLGVPLLISLLACFSFGFGPPVLVDSASRPVRLYPPQIAEIEAAQQLPALTAGAAILVDVDTGQVLLAHNDQQRLPMASTTKIMTALLALERGNLDEVVTVPASGANTGSRSGTAPKSSPLW